MWPERAALSVVVRRQRGTAASCESTALAGLLDREQPGRKPDLLRFKQCRFARKATARARSLARTIRSESQLPLAATAVLIQDERAQ
jgi:hypothetical protein